MTELSNRSLDRGIVVLESLARNGASSLAALHKDTGIAKSTIRRLLATLISHRLVRRSVSDKLYRVTIALPAGAGESAPQEMSGLIDVAMPRAAELTRQVEWPSDIHVLDGPCMRIIDSTRPLSPFHMYRGIINRRINLFGSATGVAVPGRAFRQADPRIRRYNQGKHVTGTCPVRSEFRALHVGDRSGPGTRLRNPPWRLSRRNRSRRRTCRDCGADIRSR
jgi:IclR family mhp operon transcriptional activator